MESWETQTSFVQSNDGRADLAANETDSWETDHNYYAQSVTIDGKYLGEVTWTFDIQGIQGILIVEYSEQM